MVCLHQCLILSITAIHTLMVIIIHGGYGIYGSDVTMPDGVFPYMQYVPVWQTPEGSLVLMLKFNTS